MNLRICTPSCVFFLSPDYVAARLLAHSALTYVKFAFPLLQGHIAACKMCIKFKSVKRPTQ